MFVVFLLHCHSVFWLVWWVYPLFPKVLIFMFVKTSFISQELKFSSILYGQEMQQMTLQRLLWDDTREEAQIMLGSEELNNSILSINNYFLSYFTFLFFEVFRYLTYIYTPGQTLLMLVLVSENCHESIIKTWSQI